MYSYLKRLCNAIVSNRFNELKYRDSGNYYGLDIQTRPLFCSYGEIGFTVSVFSGTQYYIQYDWELKELSINGYPYKDFINISYLEENDITLVSDAPVWKEYPRSVELECYTDAGGDMLIHLEEPSKIKLEEYINDFDINHEVSIWWPDGEPGNGVPFDNMKEHWDDLEGYLKWLRRICKKMPY